MRLRYGCVALILLSTASAAELKQETVDAWNQYVQSVDANMRERLNPARTFLWIDESPERARRAHEGEVLAEPIAAHNPRRVTSGLIHDWIGAAFFPNTRAVDVLAVLRNYAQYKDYYHPAVIASEPVRQDGSADRYAIVMLNSSVLKSAVEVESESDYVEMDARRWYCISHSDRVQSIEEYGKAGERKLPVGVGPGYIWRVHSITRLVERDGGVYVEAEAVVLSRDIPGTLRWLVDPIVRRTARNSVMTTLRETEEAVKGAATNVPMVSSLPHASGGRAFVKQ